MWQVTKRGLADAWFAARAPGPVGRMQVERPTRWVHRTTPCCGRESTHDTHEIWVHGSLWYCAACGAILIAEADYRLQLATEQEERAALATPFGERVRSVRKIIEAYAEMEARRKKNTVEGSRGA
jgi:hypothetical protein